MLSLLALGWNKRKVEQLGRTLSQRYLKVIFSTPILMCVVMGGKHQYSKNVHMNDIY